MKNILLAGILGAALSVSCSTAKTAQSNRAEFLQLKGDWEITSVDYDKNYKEVLEQQVLVHNKQSLVREMLFKIFN